MVEGIVRIDEGKGRKIIEELPGTATLALMSGFGEKTTTIHL